MKNSIRRRYTIESLIHRPNATLFHVKNEPVLRLDEYYSKTLRHDWTFEAVMVVSFFIALLLCCLPLSHALMLY